MKKLSSVWDFIGISNEEDQEKIKGWVFHPEKELLIIDGGMGKTTAAFIIAEIASLKSGAFPMIENDAGKGIPFRHNGTIVTTNDWGNLKRRLSTKKKFIRITKPEISGELNPDWLQMYKDKFNELEEEIIGWKETPYPDNNTDNLSGTINIR